MLILALDLSKSSTGFAYGRPGERPNSGSVQFGTPRHTDADVGAKAMRWLGQDVPVMLGGIPDLVAIEAAWEGHGDRSAHTSAVLIGLQFTMGAAALMFTKRQPELVKVTDARRTFTGRAGYAKGEAKPAVQKRCLDLGWLDLENLQPDRADALCVWAHIAARTNPQIAFNPPRKRA